MIPLPDQKDSFTILKPVGKIVKYGSGYIRVHAQKDRQRSDINCTGEKTSDICKNKTK